MDMVNIAGCSAAITAYVILFDSDDEDDIHDRTVLEKVDNFVEEVVPRMSHRQFRQHFRMDPTTFEDVLRKLAATYTRRNKVGNPELAFEKQVLLSVWYLANLESFRSVADRFGISKSTAWTAFYKMCLKFIRLNQIFLIITWPTAHRGRQNINMFQRKTRFPGAVGAIDGSHIPIKAPQHSQQSYVNRKGFHSILLQGVCDSKCLFLDCYTGEAGSIHDACLFRRSDLSRRWANLEFPDDSHLLGDSAYKLTQHLMVPYKNNGNLTQQERTFNTIHAKARVVIEQCFALLKGRFRRLKLIETMRIELVPIIVLSACILHCYARCKMLCILNGDNIDDIDIWNELREERIMNPHQEHMLYAMDAAARRKRDRIARALFHR